MLLDRTLNNPRNLYQRNVLNTSLNPQDDHHNQTNANQSSPLTANSPRLNSLHVRTPPMARIPYADPILMRLNSRQSRLQPLRRGALMQVLNQNKGSKKTGLDNIQTLNWHQLPTSGQYFSSDRDCCITLNKLYQLKEPILVGRHIFEFSALQQWLVKGKSHPITRKPVLVSDILAIDHHKIVPHNQLNQKRAQALIQALSTFNESAQF